MCCEWTVYTKQLKQLWFKYLGHCDTSTVPQELILARENYVMKEKRAKVMAHVSVSNLHLKPYVSLAILHVTQVLMVLSSIT